MNCISNHHKQKMADVGRHILAITVDPNGYEGSMAIGPDQASDFFYFNGPKVIPITEGKHFLNTGATLGGETGANTSYIYFLVNSDGEITLKQTNSAYLSPDKKTIILKTVSVTINVSGYRNNYGLSAKVGTVLSGNLSPIKLVSYQIYSFDSGIHLPAYSISSDKNKVLKIMDQVAKSWFNFFVDEQGTITFVDEKGIVTSTSIYANFEGGKLNLRTINVWIDPAELSNGAFIQLLDKTEVKSRQEITFLRGLLTRLDWQNATSHYYFVPM